MSDLRAAASEAAAWLESRPDRTEGDAATAARLRSALAGTADDAEPVTPEFVVACGFKPSEVAPFYRLQHDMDVPDESDRWRMAEVVFFRRVKLRIWGNRVSGAVQDPTRGQFLALCAALGVPLAAGAG